MSSTSPGRVALAIFGGRSIDQEAFDTVEEMVTQYVKSRSPRECGYYGSRAHLAYLRRVIDTATKTAAVVQRKLKTEARRNRRSKRAGSGATEDMGG